MAANRRVLRHNDGRASCLQNHRRALFFFFQAEDGIRDDLVTGVQTCALPISVRNVHLLATRTRLTPRLAYSACSWASAALISTPSGIRLASVACSSGSAEANRRASRMRNSSGRTSGSLATISSGSSMRSSAKLAMARSPSSLLNRQVRRSHRAGLVRWTLTKIQRRERLLLVQLELAFADQFQHGRKARGEDGGLLCGLGDVIQQVIVETSPIVRYLGHADQPLERRARLGKRPDGALGHMNGGHDTRLALDGVGRQQIEQGGREFGTPDFGDLRSEERRVG